MDTLLRFELPGFAGTLMHPDHTEYDGARRVFNGMIDRRPALIARCANADDVVLAVNLAREGGFPITAYGGGHAVTGHAVCDDGICVDLRGMKGVAIDPATRTGRFEAGLNWGEFDRATDAHGLAMTGGRNETTGISGLALGSGSGWLERKFGYVCDNLLKAELVTADGRKVIASPDENADLFWGLRGGGGNFGIVTVFHFQLHRLPRQILAGPLVYPASMAKDVMTFFREFMRTAPDELGGGLQIVTMPPESMLPESVRGQPAVMIQAVCATTPEEGSTIIAPILSALPPAANLCRPINYAEYQAGGPFMPGLQNYWTADFLTDLPDEAIDILAAYALDPISPFGNVILVPGGGAPSRVPEEATAFGMRTAPWNIHFIYSWPDPSDNDENIAAVRALSRSIKPWATGRVYLNYIGNEGQERIDSSFGEVKMARLRQLKRKWDPDNFFRHNQNIRPSDYPS
jgi:FAD/FMN-containing dehydrogenase